MRSRVSWLGIPLPPGIIYEEIVHLKAEKEFLDEKYPNIDYEFQDFYDLCYINVYWKCDEIDDEDEAGRCLAMATNLADHLELSYEYADREALYLTNIAYLLDVMHILNTDDMKEVLENAN